MLMPRPPTKRRDPRRSKREKRLVALDCAKPHFCGGVNRFRLTRDAEAGNGNAAMFEYPLAGTDLGPACVQEVVGQNRRLRDRRYKQADRGGSASRRRPVGKVADTCLWCCIVPLKTRLFLTPFCGFDSLRAVGAHGLLFRSLDEWQYFG